jgi:DNA (cytosine-5)-methyltransferase 1
MAYYNEINPYAAAWLRNLIAAGHIAPGDVDERSIEDVEPGDLNGYTQCHFFAGIGVWSYALRLAGWPDGEPVWTGSCPCQPFSVAGKGRGTSDDRHLWPAWHRLISERCPRVVFGEQVEAAIKHGWLDLVQSDMEGSGYAFAAIGLPAAGVGAPHIRQRLFFVADSCRSGFSKRIGDGRFQREEVFASDGQTDKCSRNACGLEYPGSVGWDGRETPAPGYDDNRTTPKRAQGEYGLGISSTHRLHQHGASPTNGLWRDADWLYCRDGKWRPVEPGTFPLAHGASARMGRLHAYGNAIVPQVAAEVIGAYMDINADDFLYGQVLPKRTGEK